ncbi:MAG: NAD-dependent dehydratase [Micromonosporaceae bacterium]|nr:NAD-dependent dehydratase [Micromonosporaceae bacterium]
MRSALVVGGTGPTGPDVVNGLLARGFEVTIFHSGFHEAEFAGEVRHIHGDPHFRHTIEDALGHAEFDVVIAQYGRLRHLTAHFAGRAGHLVGIGGATGQLAAQAATEWGGLGRPAVITEGQQILETDEQRNKFGFRMAQAYQGLFEAHARGDFRATYIGYPMLYGPHQPGLREWCIVRRILDGRRQIVLPDGGLKLESRGYVANVSLAPLLAVDRPEISGGRAYVVADSEIHTLRQRVEFIAGYLEHELEIVDVPFPYAGPAHPLYRSSREHRVGISQRIRDELGYVDTYSATEGLARTVDWLTANPPPPGGELEQQLGDPFDYPGEDEVILAWGQAVEQLRRVTYDVPEYAHIYRHPKQPNEQWTRPADPKRPA